MTGMTWDGSHNSGVWSTPLHAPLVPRFPIAYRNAQILSVVYRTTPEAVRSHLPAALEPTGDSVMIHIYRFPDVQAMGAVNECNVMVGARLSTDPLVTGGFSTSLFIDSDVGLAQGREIHGQPKKLAETALRTRGDLIVGRVKRNGFTLLRATTPYKQSVGEIESLKGYFDFTTNLNLKVIRNIDGSMGLCQVTSRRLEDVVVHGCWEGPATVELHPNAQAPVHLLPVIEVLRGFYWEADFNLVGGTIELDLAPSQDPLEPDARLKRVGSAATGQSFSQDTIQPETSEGLGFEPPEAPDRI